MSDTLLQAQIRRRAGDRRNAMEAAGCQTYELIAATGPENGGIVCCCCGYKSYHPVDVTEKYCAFCDEYHAGERAKWSEPPPDLLRPEPAPYSVAQEQS